MSIKYTLFLLVILTCCKSAKNTQFIESYWNEIKIEQSQSYLPSKYISYELKLDELNLDVEENSKINLPIPDLGIKRFSVIHSGTMSPELAKKFPNIKSFKILNDQNELLGSLDINNSGLYAMISIENSTFFINPVTKKSVQYICYEKQYAFKDLNNPFIDQVIK